MQIKRVQSNDIDLLVDNRIEFICSFATIPNLDQFRKQTKDFITKHIEDDTIISYIAIDDKKVVSSCILCIYDVLPLPSCLSGKCGLLLNVYTIKEYRRKGLAYDLLTKLIHDAKILGVGKILVDYTDDGFPLYNKLGFEKLDRELVLKL